MSLPNIAIDAVRDKLLTLEQVDFELSRTEPLSTEDVTKDTQVLFKFDQDWDHGIDSVPGTAGVDALMRINGTDHQMTKESALMAGANYGLSSSLMKSLPTNLLEQTLNYFYATGAKEYNALIVQDRLAAFTRPSIVPFSNLELLDNALQGIRGVYGNDAEVLADYKFQNSLLKTDIRLVIPAGSRTIEGSNMTDVPSGASDDWSVGLHLSNSLVGKTQTELDAYLFRYWCTNGCTTTNTDAGVWSRRSNGQDLDVYEWARSSVEDVLGGLEGAFDRIQAMTSINVAGNTAEVVNDIYQRYGIPISARAGINERLIESESLSLYDIMQAITAEANQDGLSDSKRDTLMRAGGDLPFSVFSTVKESVWREGNSAPAGSHNPYAIG